ncbi:MAG TPA: acyl-CoA synthetase [Vicinamibacterales bacterium]|jgi:malonyl-CoA/methylmalonyl-CoA synthetase|nr:acyl-CoA synthetase [Vicinamibacterales bacterium]
MSESRLAIIASDGTFTYDDLDDASRRVAGSLLGDNDDLRQTRVAFLISPSFAYAAVQRGVWRAGGVAVPLAVSHPPAELEYVIRDSGASVVVAGPGFEDVLAPLAKAVRARFVCAADALKASPATDLPHLPSARRALIIYTSGTTGKPKGAVTTHENVGSQVAALVQAWGWRPSDRLLLVLPLHHVHGIINGLGSALAVRATCEILPAFDAGKVWERLASGEITVFTAVPTIYSKLIAAWDAAPALQAARSAGVRRLRLMMSGSAALPVHVLERWREISGHTLLERYGMTEIGMALSNPLEGERRPGSVGQPLPGVDVHLVDEDGIEVAEGTPGELEVRGPAVFHEYWQRPEETAGAFRNGWFRTGDMAVLENGSYRLLGRTSVDIIKTGGFKVSALEIEEVLRTHPAVAECAVVGVNDPEWGERVSAAVELKPGASLSLDDLQRWAKTILAPYKVPRALAPVDALPRNAMGKVVKPQVARLFE